MSRPRIGALRHRVQLEGSIRTADGGGGASVAWTSVAEIWAAIEPITGAESVLGEGVAGRVTHEIVVRYRIGLEPSMRFRLGARIFEIKAVLDVDERRRMLRCHCREELP